MTDTAPKTEAKVLTFTVSEEGCSVEDPPDTTLNDFEAANSTLMCILLAQHLRKGGVAEALSWRNQCYNAMTAFISDYLDGTAHAAGFFSSALEDETEEEDEDNAELVSELRKALQDTEVVEILNEDTPPEK